MEHVQVDQGGRAVRGLQQVHHKERKSIRDRLVENKANAHSSFAFHQTQLTSWHRSLQAQYC
jgi:hypothetical protein